jgi:photosystem II stability/assembly factor-like uncharacterized protein
VLSRRADDVDRLARQVGRFTARDGGADFPRDCDSERGTRGHFALVSPEKTLRTSQRIFWISSLKERRPVLPDALFPTRSALANYASVGLDLYESRDGGKAWRRIGTVEDRRFPLERVGLLSLELNSGEIFAGVGNQSPRQTGGLFRSSDGGRTWKAYPELIGLTVYDILVIDEDTILIATHQRVHRTTDGGRSWKEIGPAGVEARIRDLALDPGIGAIYAGTSGLGVWKSTDGGNSWVAKSVGMRSPATYAVEVDPTQAGVIWAGASGGGMYRSSDGGESWSQVEDISPRTIVSRIHFPEPSSKLGLVATGDGLYCRSWSVSMASD